MFVGQLKYDKLNLSAKPWQRGLRLTICFMTYDTVSFGLPYVSWYKYLIVSLFFPTSVFGVGIFF